jgi:hypothetical protein
MDLNGYSIVSRHNRPTVLNRVALQVNFINNGVYQDPYAISSVTIVPLTANTSPSSVLTSSNILDASIVSAIVKMNFQNSSTLVTNSTFNASTYAPGSTASGIYRESTGKYVVVLDGAVSLSGAYEGTVIQNTASAVGDFVDIWTVKWVSSNDWQVFINRFHLYNDTVFTITEPLLVTPHARLANKRVKLNSVVDLKIPVEVTIQNRNIPESVKNIFQESFIVNPSIQIVKLNHDDAPLASRVVVSSFSDTSSTCDVTADNTILFNFNTSNLFTLPAVANGTFGSISGEYTVQAKFTILNQTFYSELMALIID